MSRSSRAWRRGRPTRRPITIRPLLTMSPASRWTIRGVTASRRSRWTRSPAPRAAPTLCLAAGDPVRVLQPRLRDPRPRRDGRPAGRRTASRPTAPPGAPRPDRQGYDDGRDPRTVSPAATCAATTVGREGHDADGALAPMGGLYSSVRDLPAWVGCFAATRSPPATTPMGRRPLTRSSRREMQQVQRVMPSRAGLPGPRGPAGRGVRLRLRAVPRPRGTTSAPTWGTAAGYPGYGR